MAINVEVSVGSVSIQGNDFPIYGTFDRATEYLSASLSGDVFSGASFTAKNQGLVMARRFIDRQRFKGSPTVTGQFTSFPRDGSSTVPLAIEFAQYELSVVLIGDPDRFTHSDGGSNEKRLRAGSVEIEFFQSTLAGSGGSGLPKVFPDHVQDLILPFLDVSSSLSTYAGGTGNVSSVICEDDYGLSWPL